MRPRLEVRGLRLSEDGESRPHQSGRGRQFHGLPVMVSINILMGSAVCCIMVVALLAVQLLANNATLFYSPAGTSARTWLKDPKLTWPTATDLLLFLSDIPRDVQWILEDQTLQLWIHIYILWGKDLAAGAEGAVKYWRLLRGIPNIALLLNSRFFFIKHISIFFFLIATLRR